MDRFKEDWNRAQTCGDFNNTMEPEYDVVDDQEEIHNVRILPARPISEDREYADRDLPRQSPAQNLSSVTTRKRLPRCPPRKTSHIKGPAINRDLKPGRQKIKLDKKPPPLEPEDQPSRRCSPPHPPFTLDATKELAGLAVDEVCRSDRHLINTEKMDLRSPVTSPRQAKSVSPMLTHQRHSLDLETHDLENRSHQHLERVPSKRHHHEWPQTKEDIDQNDFVPMDKPYTYCEEDWYVGPCNRTDAEHALHLVNKDGAFLVRDCSINTNSEPLVLVVYYEKKVYNVKIRFFEATRKYALGTGQRSNDMFDSVAEIIKFHSIFPITLISGRNTAGSKCPENCVLTCPITEKDVVQLLQ
ncbi:cytokine-dependent hematopoietic cell linker isoform X1 [Girardinichthys multiradiatus]|uniref:cytokine-dependent hematopoietic cell linker isoform X1 n=1 Tax=Girardinichthys multiradiatus TaxID=208333 RepID=UPI001FADEF07|nr:cytokine-dependent hematopoietic cell linker isoform X1 [Girardinichthys multiradiatus]XP_047208886.1 cytokine-dependent hematopoietic cell linker isoform X1 [Girardinichthys multiradiatus]